MYNGSLDSVPSSPFLQKSPCRSLETEPASPREATEPARAPMLRRRPEQRCTMPSSRLDGAQIRGARRGGREPSRQNILQRRCSRCPRKGTSSAAAAAAAAVHTVGRKSGSAAARSAAPSVALAATAPCSPLRHAL